jgi:ribosomal protein S18 acetylase RimI-like enzyme
VISNDGTTVTIRKLTRKDIPQLRELAIRIYRATFSNLNSPENMEAFLQKDYSIDAFNLEFDDQTSAYYFACADNSPVGYLRLRKTNEAEPYLGTNTIELHRLYVDPSYQGRGVGRDLMQFALDYAFELKVEWIWLGVWEHNPKAQEIYRKWGFEKFGEHVFQMGDDAQTDWLMKKKILPK